MTKGLISTLEFLGQKSAHCWTQALSKNSVLGKEGLWLLQKFSAFLKTCEGKFVQTADSKQHKITGQVILPMTLQGRTEQISVLVVPSLQQNLILGIDFWDRMQIVADMHNQRWDFWPES